MTRRAEYKSKPTPRSTVKAQGSFAKPSVRSKRFGAESSQKFLPMRKRDEKVQSKMTTIRSAKIGKGESKTKKHSFKT